MAMFDKYVVINDVFILYFNITKPAPLVIEWPVTPLDIFVRQWIKKCGLCKTYTSSNLLHHSAFMVDHIREKNKKKERKLSHPIIVFPSKIDVLQSYDLQS